MKLKFLLTLLFLHFPLMAQDSLCDENLSKVPTQAGGRIKPLYVLAKESIEFVFAAKPKMPVTTLFCLLSTVSIHDFPEKSELLLKVEHPEAKKFLGLEEHAKGITLDSIINREDDIKRQYFARKENDSLKKEYNKILIRLQTFISIISGEAWTIPHTTPNNMTEWLPVKNFLDVWKTKNALTTQQEILSAGEFYTNNNGNKHLIEYYYFKTKPAVWALTLSLLAMILLITLPKSNISLAITSLNLALQIATIATRVIISGRAPITNMYETVIFSGFGALLIATILFLVKKEKLYLLSGLGYNFLTLLMSIFANNMLSPAISPLVPVLRDNFWLSTHVTTVILSYAALSVSWMLANLVLLQKIFNFKIFSHYQEKVMAPLIHNSVKVGVVLLSTGVILGGIWADYSWGRFWGWDPKETWSLIVLLIYIAILHGKYTSWINNQRFIPLIAFAFLSVMMAWFGVNYILASGLHSYGFSEGGAIFLGSFFVVQITILVMHYFKENSIQLFSKNE